MNANERSPRQTAFTPLLGRHHEARTPVVAHPRETVARLTSSVAATMLTGSPLACLVGLRATCSALCRFLVAMILSSLPAPNVAAQRSHIVDQRIGVRPPTAARPTLVAKALDMSHEQIATCIDPESGPSNRAERLEQQPDEQPCADHGSLLPTAARLPTPGVCSGSTTLISELSPAPSATADGDGDSAAAPWPSPPVGIVVGGYAW
jgi:hypothetical protein